MNKAKSTSEEVNRMPSSIKMIKATHVSGEQSTAKIETKVEEKMIPNRQDASDLKASGVTPVGLAKQHANDILAQAEQERQTLMFETLKEIEELKTKAYDEAYQSGLKAGHDEGYQQGYAQATEQAQIENEQELEKIQLMREETLAEIDQYKFDKKDELIKLASHMAEKIIHKEIDASDKGILALAEPYFYQLDREEDRIAITVHPSNREQLESQLEDIEKIVPGTRIVIYGNPKVKKDGLIIESSRAVIDLEVKKQLEAMLQEIDEMERTVDA